MDEQRILGGRYLLKDKVGTGGMATVYRAQDMTLNRVVAVKLMLPQYASDATFAARFKQEAQAAAVLSSPYIVGVYDWGRDGDTYYIVMEYLRGTDLKSGVRSHGALDPKKVAQIGSQICSALAVAHKHEIIHRDIKPQNIMVLPDGNVKVMDFGIARAKNSHLTQDNNVLGTAHYVSPEQTRGQELTPASDIYSLGVVMYECVTGKVPFDGDDAISVALKQVNEQPVPPSQINPRVDSDLERIILACMQKDPAARPQSADTLRQLLNNYLTERVVDVPEPTRVIGAPGVSAAATRVMSDKTQAMVRPASVGNTTARPNVATTSYSDDTAETDTLSKGKIAAIVVGIIAVIAIAIFAVSSLIGSAEDVEVPNVISMEQEAAVEALRNAGFEVDPQKQYSDSDDDKGKVIDQTPKGGEKAAKGSTVIIVISDGKEPEKTVEMPSLVNKTAEEAEALLAEAGLTGKPTEEENEDVEEGVVFWQGVDAGTEVAEGSEIEYKVAKAPDSVSVPDLSGMTESEASSALDSAGFGMTSDYAYDDSVSKGEVIRWNPSGKQKKGTQISVIISLGKQTQSINVDNLGLVGLSEAEAKSLLSECGLKYTTQSTSSATVAEGLVVKYSPTGSVEQGQTVTLYISTGPGASAGNS